VGRLEWQQRQQWHKATRSTMSPTT
jgi:hypothetical protein